MSNQRKIAIVRFHAAEYALLIGVNPALVLDARHPGQCAGTTAARRAAFRIAKVIGIELRVLVLEFHCQRDGNASTGAAHPWRKLAWRSAA